MLVKSFGYFMETRKSLPILHKTVFRADFKPSLAFYEDMFKVLPKFDEYKDWQTTGTKSRLIDHANHCNLAIESSVILFEQDSADEPLALKRISQAIHLLCESLPYKTLQRVGLRKRFLTPMKLRLNDLVKLLDLKTYNQDRVFRSVIPGKIDDVIFSAKSADKQFRYNYLFGPCSRPEVESLLAVETQYNFTPEQLVKYREGYPEVSIFFDIDAYASHGLDGHLTTADELFETYLEANSKINKSITDTNNYLIG